MIFLIWVAFIYTSIAKYSFSEVDSYVLPSISIQYRHSIIMTQADIDQAKIDFPNLYSNVNCYDDLRASKLVIMLFADYFFGEFMEDHKFFLKKDGLVKTLKLCSCYIPSLIPFILNKIYLNTWNPTVAIVKINGDSWGKRFLAYFFDLNLGIASFAMITVLLFLAALVYSIVKKNRRMFLECTAAILTIFLFASHRHINCGMRYCARYVMWVYPVVVFAVCDFLNHFFENKKRVQIIINTFSIICSVAVISFNGINYNRKDFSSVSKIILDNFPNLYVSFCESTFNSRTKHIDGAYFLEKMGGYSIYCDSKTGEIRKVLYINNSEVKERLSEIIQSNDETDFSSLFKTEDNDAHYYINIPRSSKTQYTEDKVKALVLDIFKVNDIAYDDILLNRIVYGIYSNNENSIEFLFNCLDEDIPNKELVHKFYTNLLGRNESARENKLQCERLESGEYSKHDLFFSFFRSKEFKQNNNIGKYELKNFSRIDELKMYIDYWSSRNNVSLSSDEVTMYANGLAERSEETINTVYSWFMNNEEFANYTDEEYIEFLYTTLLGRHSDKKGLSTWCERLSDGVTREEAFYRFFCSKEFQNNLISEGSEQ